MTFIPRKDEYDNGQPQEQPRVAIDRSWKFNTNWGKVAEDTKFFDGLFTLFVYFTIFMNLASTGLSFEKGNMVEGLGNLPLTVFCNIFLGVCVINALINAGGFNFIAQQIMSLVGAFAEPVDISFKEMEDDRRRDAKDRQETADRCAKYYQKDNNSSNDNRDFNTKQKEARKAAAYAKADPEFIVTYKSKGGCWVTDIVRGRDKAEVLNRFRANPMVEYMGGVMGIYE